MFWLNSYLLLVNANFLYNFEILTKLKRFAYGTMTICKKTQVTQKVILIFLNQIIKQLTIKSKIYGKK